MFIDSSVIVAILNEEPGAIELEKQLEAADGTLLFSPLVRFEATISLARAIGDRQKTGRSPELVDLAQSLVDQLLHACGAEEVSIDSGIGSRAIGAARTYGKAVGHPADLNFGDCFSYACAKAAGAKLLYKGEDFAKTDMA